MTEPEEPSQHYPTLLQVLAIVWLCLLCSCGETYVETPPFDRLNDTIRISADNWYYLSGQADRVDGVAVFPFAYRIFGASMEGFLVNSPPRVYVYKDEESFDKRTVLLDTGLSPGDTVEKVSRFQYQILLDRKTDPVAGGEVFYILRRSLIGLKSFRERTIWVVSAQKGILAAASYDIGATDGIITLDISGDPDYFNSDDLKYKIKYYDYDQTSYVDRDRNLIYVFDKFKGSLKVRDFKATQDLYEYTFDKVNTRELVDFKLEMRENQIELRAGDSCFYFTPELDLTRSGPCP
ncbi:MAG: hypothetical protein EAZ89_17505 [Bacteroidetes bacterium]|nr:MAG: hypothetical protein EAZ89_17505 [Bacteroidota bacterium]